MLQILFMFIFVQVTMEIEHQDIQKTPSTIYFVEEMKPEYIEYIDACKIRAQTDSAYWQVLKESMSTGMIQLDGDDGNDSNTNVSDNVSTDNMSADDTSIKSLLEYQIKMLENLNYAVDMLTEKCDELTKYCAKLANRLKKYGVEHDTTVDVNGITSNNVMPETSISLKRRVHTDNDSTTDSLEESSNNVETVEV